MNQSYYDPMAEAEGNLFYDPTVENDAQIVDPFEAFQQIEAAYLNNEVHHDYTGDKFVADTEALMLDATFIERFDAVQAIAARMHQLCGENHGLSQDMLGNIDSLSGHSANDGHNHAENKHNKHDDDDEYEIDPETGKKRKKKKQRR